MILALPNPVDMGVHSKRVFNGWLNLATEEQQALVDAIAAYQQGDEVDKAEFRRRGGFTSLETGPLTHTCPCCGR
jgi:hypothetical protein